MSFLIVFLLYACYQPLRFSIEDPERQARYAAVFAIVAGAFVPLNFMAVRMAESLVAPARARDDRRLDAGLDAADVPGGAGRDGVPVRDAVEVRAGVQARDVPAAGARSASSADEELGPQPAPVGGAAAVMPALPLDEAGKYVAAAYLVFLALVLIYVAIMAGRLARHRARPRRGRSSCSSSAGRGDEREAVAR